MKKNITIHPEDKYCGVFHLSMIDFSSEIENVKNEMSKKSFPFDGFLGKIMQWLDHKETKKIIAEIDSFQKSIETNGNSEVVLRLQDYDETIMFLLYRLIDELLEKQKCQIQCAKCAQIIDCQDIEKVPWSNVKNPSSGVGGTRLLCKQNHLLYERHEWIA